MPNHAEAETINTTTSLNETGERAVASTTGEKQAANETPHLSNVQTAGSLDGHADSDIPDYIREEIPLPSEIPQEIHDDLAHDMEHGEMAAAAEEALEGERAIEELPSSEKRPENEHTAEKLSAVEENIDEERTTSEPLVAENNTADEQTAEESPVTEENLEEELAEIAQAHGHDLSRYEQIAIEFDRPRQQEPVQEARETGEEKAEEIEEGQKMPAPAAPVQEGELLPPRPAYPSKFNRGQEPEQTGGKIHIDYTFERFNASGEYSEVKGFRSFMNKKLNPKNLLGMKTEAVFEHKGDGSKITIRQDAVICDNTPGNLSAALDIAEDKGWDVIKITGGSRAAKAELWFQAKMRGFDTRGYKPNEMDMKRLLGAQEREHKAQEAEAAKQGQLVDSLDITPRTTPTEEPSRSAEEAQGTVKVPEKSGQLPQTGAGTKEAKKEKNVDTPAYIQDDSLSNDERFRLMAKEIMAEVAKVVPLNTDEYQNIEDATVKQLAMAHNMGLKVNMEQVKKDIQKGLPVMRNELEKAGHDEQLLSEKDRAREERNKTRLPEKRPELHTKRSRSLEGR